MLDWLLSVFYEFRQNFRVADAIDILLITVLLYSGLVWFRNRASRGILLGFTILTLIYFLARAFDLYLTTLVFHTGFAVALVVIVILFQEDLRRLFERLASFGTLRPRRREQEHGHVIHMLVEASFNLAHQRVGALVVLKGRESLERHLNRGSQLQGQISLPLLYSIFDTHSPGHDGAAIIDRDQIIMFGVHLPISKNPTELQGRGTRHSAALGLSECSDAMVLTVSEERGLVSVAERGMLQTMSARADLKQRLENFYETHFPTKKETFWQRIVTQHVHLKLLSAVLACVAWFVLAYQPATIQRIFAVSVEYRNLSQRLVLDEYAPTEARVTLSGSERAFRFFDPTTMKITIDMSSAVEGRFRHSMTEKDLRLPQNLELYRIEPPVLTVFLRASNTQ